MKEKPKRVGRPFKNQKLRVIKIQCTPEELTRILEGIPDTRERTMILLRAIEQEGNIFILDADTLTELATLIKQYPKEPVVNLLETLTK